jgi:hypothetical protein
LKVASGLRAHGASRDHARAMDLRVLGLSLVLLAAAPAIAAAQEPPVEAPSARAVRATGRREFQRGVEAAERGEWAAARDSFRRSYDLVPRARTLSNLATALAHVGALVEAVDTYRSVVADPTAPEPVLAEARRALALIEPRVPRVHVQTEAAGAHRITIDGVEVPLAVAGAEVPLDPGAHEIVLSLGDRTCARASVVVAESERSVAALAPCLEIAPSASEPPEESPAPVISLAAIAPPPPVVTEVVLEEPDVSEPHAQSSIVESPWLWIGVGVLVAGAIGLGVGLSLAPSPSLPAGNVAGTGAIVVP